ncbi:hypothetical protein F4808DRAFT_474497 [Astrocystis sublimbata]|nr:hypothetical protein F4808DRAFT_474497 [Astrocystis sublimbata]
MFHLLGEKERKDTFTNLNPCIPGIFDEDHVMCCGNDANTNCCGANFTVSIGNPFAPPMISTTTYMSSTPTPSLPITPTSCASSLGPTGMASSSPPTGGYVGAAVGTGAGVGLVGLVLIMWRERVWKRRAMELKNDQTARQSKVNKGSQPFQIGATQGGLPAEVSSSNYPMPQID